MGTSGTLLRDQDEYLCLLKESGLVKPYSDPSLVNRPDKYDGFLKEMCCRGMVELERFQDTPTTVGVFFVKKKSGDLRLIADT
eukprot:4723808-Amphidinium_carterae.2